MTCESRLTARMETPTPATPVMIGNTAAQTDRNTSIRIIRAARMPAISLIPPGWILVKAPPPTWTSSRPVAAACASFCAAASWLSEVKTTVAYAVRESALTCFAPAAVNGLITPFTPSTLATLASIGKILELAAGESAEPLPVCHTMVPVVTLAASLPAPASRLYAVVESLAGSREESLKADPATPTTPPSATSIAIQESRIIFLCRMHQRASPVMTRTPFESQMIGVINSPGNATVTRPPRAVTSAYHERSTSSLSRQQHVVSQLM